MKEKVPNLDRLPMHTNQHKRTKYTPEKMLNTIKAHIRSKSPKAKSSPRSFLQQVELFNNTLYSNYPDPDEEDYYDPRILIQDDPAFYHDFNNPDSPQLHQNQQVLEEKLANLRRLLAEEEAERERESKLRSDQPKPLNQPKPLGFSVKMPESRDNSSNKKKPRNVVKYDYADFYGRDSSNFQSNNTMVSPPKETSFIARS